MCHSGIFEGQRVEFLGGEIVPMAPQSNHRAATIDQIRETLKEIFGKGYWVRAQFTLDLAPHAVPDPDVAVIEGDREHPGDALPTHALLVVEVSDSRLTYDRTRKASLYASCGIQDYWIGNLPDRQLEIRRDPQPDTTHEFGHGYATLTTLRPGDSPSPLAAPHGSIPVERLFFS